MGWTEDDEEYVITEDDKKEMQKSIQLVGTVVYECCILTFH